MLVKVMSAITYFNIASEYLIYDRHLTTQSVSLNFTMSKVQPIFIALLNLFLSYQSVAQCVNITWHNPDPQANNLNDIEFLSDSVVVAIGDMGVLIRSEDAGLTWDALPQLPTYNYTSLFFTDSLTGYACGAMSNTGIIIKTVDGGLHWTVLEEGGAPEISTTRTLWFTNDSVGYCGTFQKILKTTDAGENWTAYSFSEAYPHQDIEFINENIGFSVAGGRIFRTLNAGSSWTQVFYDSNYLLNEINFVNDTLGFVSVFSSVTKMYKTIDGGSTWAVFNIPVSWVVDSYEFVNDSTGYLAAGSSTNIYKSVDYGSTWSIVGNLNLGSNFLGFATNDLGYIVSVGENGIIYQSSQDGTLNSWTNRVDGSQYSIRCLDMTDENTGYFAAPGYILKTTDACETLVPTSISNTKTPNCIHFPTPDFGFVVGQDGLRYRTTNAGTIWQNLSINTALDTYAVYFLNEQIGFMCGEGGSVQKTIDGGTTWTTIATGLSTYLRDVYFLNSDTGFVCGYNSVFKKTVDGGVTWTNIPTGTTSLSLYKIHFANDSLGFCTGSSGFYARTTDGGANWIVSGGFWASGITDIQFVNDLEGFYVLSGYSGAIYRTWDAGLTWQFYGIVNNDGIEEIDAINGNAVFGVGGYYGALWEFNPAIPAPNLPDTIVACDGLFIQSQVPPGFHTRWMYSNTFGSIINEEDSLDVSLLAGDTTIWVLYWNEACESIHRPVFIDKQNIPDAPQIFATDLELCTGETSLLSSNATETIHWSNGASSASLEVNQAGDYFAFSGNGNCLSISSDTLHIISLETPAAPVIEVMPFDPCSAAVVSINASGNGEIVWYDSQQNQLPVLDSILLTNELSADTIFYASLISADGCESNKVEIPVEFIETPPAPFITALSQVVCENETTTLSVENIYPLYWSNDSVTQSINVGAGTYSVFYSNEGCQSDSALITIEEIIVPMPVIQASTLIFCEGDSAILSTEPLFDLYWSTNETTPSIEITTAGIYNVYYQNEMCIGDTAEIEITTSALPDVPVILEDSNGTFTLSTSTGWANYDWYLEGVLLPDNHTSIFPTNGVMGAYQVVVYNEDGCSSPSEVFEYTYFGIDEENSTLIIYPNPVNDMLTIDTGTFIADEYKILDNTGKLVYHTINSNRSSLFNLDLSSLPSGKYTIELIARNGATHKRGFVKL